MQYLPGRSKVCASLRLMALFALATCLTVSASPFQVRKQPHRPPQSEKTTSSSRWLQRVASKSDFDRLARIYYRGRFYALPHLMFVIDRRAGGRVYYVNSKLFSFHKDFVNATYLSLERGRAFYENNYLKPDRRFLWGPLHIKPPARSSPSSSGKVTN